MYSGIFNSRKIQSMVISTESHQELNTEEDSESQIQELQALGYVEECFVPGHGWKFTITDKGRKFYSENAISLEEFEDEVSLEDIIPADQRDITKMTRFMIKLAGLMVTVPKMTFDSRDWNPKIVDKMMKHPELLKVVGEWIQFPDQNHVGNLVKAFKVLSPMQPRSNIKKLYRGFNLQGTGQQALGLKLKGFFKKKPANFTVGGKMEYVTDKAISFTEFEATATSFGNAIVSIDPNRYRNRLFSLEPNISIAVSRIMYPDYPEREFNYFYAEHILLPSPDPIEFTIEAFGKQKTQVK